MQTTTTPTPVAQPAAPAEQQRPLWLSLLPEDGILTVFLLVVMVYTTISSIQSVDPPWTDGLSVLTPTTGMGLLLGYLSVQQRRLPGSLVQFVAMVLGILFSFQETANQVLGGSRSALWTHTKTWFHQAVILHQSSDDNTVFLLFLAILSFLLAYISVWLVLRTRRPWLAALANCVVLLINLNKSPMDQSVFFVVLFLLATLLLLVRFTLAENMRRWRARGLRFSPDLSWDFMQAGAIFVVAVLLAAYILPAGGPHSAVNNLWNSPNSPWQQLQTRFSAMFNGIHGNGPGTINFFGSDLQLTNTVNLPNVDILRYAPATGDDDGQQYLLTKTLDTYDGHGGWNNSLSDTTAYPANAVEPSTTLFSKLNTEHISILRSLGDNTLFAPGDEGATFSVPAQVVVNPEHSGTSWSSKSPVAAGDHYDASGYVSVATIAQLEKVPFPAQDTSATDFPGSLTQEYLLSTPPSLVDPAVAQTAQQVTASATTMYDKALALEDYLRQFKYSLTNPAVPSGQDPIAFFLQTKQGFCTHFATAMAVMGRSLGMPTRIAEGFAAGEFDAKTNTFLVKGTQAHVWTQIYFAQYGWINFEPTASFGKFARALGNTAGGPTPTTGTPGAGSRTPSARSTRSTEFGNPGGSSGKSSPINSTAVGVGIGASLFIIIVLICAMVAMIWWRLLYRGLSPVTSAFARVARLGSWAGAPPARSQTPSEYAEELSEVIPLQRESLRTLSDLYSRERWGGGLGQEQQRELPRLYDQIRTAVTRVIAGRLRYAPGQLLQRRAQRRSRRRQDPDR